MISLEFIRITWTKMAEIHTGFSLGGGEEIRERFVKSQKPFSHMKMVKSWSWKLGQTTTNSYNFFITYIKINSEGVKKKLGWKSQGSHNLHETMGLKQSRKYNYVCWLVCNDYLPFIVQEHAKGC